MFGVIAGLLFKLPGLAESLLGYLQKRADVGLETTKAELKADTQINMELLRGRIEEMKIAADRRAADRGSIWTAWQVPIGFTLPTAIHYWAIVLDSMPFPTFWGHHLIGSWQISVLPGKFGEYEGQILLAAIGVAGTQYVVGRILSKR